jgi:alpha-1,6-mannosyltransferase
MVGAGLVRSSWMPPPLRMPVPGPPWELTIQVSARLTVVLVWTSALLATAGVIGALVAVRRGLPVPIRTLLVAAAIAVVAMTVLPPFGSTDPLDYAVYGHIVALGHSPYVMTPLHYRRLTGASGVPLDWQRDPSVYGPLATAEQYLAARLGGASLARTAFWLKLANAVGLAAIAFVADRMLRRNPAARLRAHLLWTANPLVLWAAIAGGHVDLFAAVFGVAGVLVVDRQVFSRPLVNALVAGLCVGAATDVKAAFALFALAIAWSLRRAPRQLAAAAAGGIAVLVPSYAWVGMPAIRALTSRAATGEGWGFWGFVFHHLGIPLHYAVPAAVCLLIPVAWLALTRLPAGFDDQPAARAALALSLAWLLVWPHQYAWYSLMVICVLILFPASRLDWLALVWLGVMTYTNMPGTGIGQVQRLGHTIIHLQSENLDRVAPVVMLATLAAMVVWCFTRRWHSAGSSTKAAAVRLQPPAEYLADLRGRPTEQADQEFAEPGGRGGRGDHGLRPHLR